MQKLSAAIFLFFNVCTATYQRLPYGDDGAREAREGHTQSTMQLHVQTIVGLLPVLVKSQPHLCEIYRHFINYVYCFVSNQLNLLQKKYIGIRKYDIELRKWTCYKFIANVRGYLWSSFKSLTWSIENTITNRDHLVYPIPTPKNTSYLLLYLLYCFQSTSEADQDLRIYLSRKTSPNYSKREFIFSFLGRVMMNIKLF